MDIDEELVQEVEAITLSNTDYCVIVDPYDENNVQRLGTQVRRSSPVQAE